MIVSRLQTEQVLSVHHWTDRLFSFTTSRDPSFRFENGHFTMVGLEVDNRPLLRAYSMVSANYEDQLEFFSIKVQEGPLTSRLQHIQPGDEVLISRKATGTLVLDHLLPGRHIYLLATGTGLAPFLSIIKDPELYERYEKIVLVHGCRRIEDLAYQDAITHGLPQNEYFGEQVMEKLIYYPTVTREPFRNQGRITELIKSGKLFEDIGLPGISLEDDRFMLCGSPAMLEDTTTMLESFGLTESRHGKQAHYVIERAFAER